jgi:hypothetical protein
MRFGTFPVRSLATALSLALLATPTYAQREDRGERGDRQPRAERSDRGSRGDQPGGRDNRGPRQGDWRNASDQGREGRGREDRGREDRAREERARGDRGREQQARNHRDEGRRGDHGRSGWNVGTSGSRHDFRPGSPRPGYQSRPPVHSFHDRGHGRPPAVWATPQVRPHHRPPARGYYAYHGRQRIVVPPPRARYYRDVIVVRPYGGWYAGYGHYRNDDAALRWLGFTALTMVIFNAFSEIQQRAHEDAQIRATTVPLGNSVTWSSNGAYGAVTPIRESNNAYGQYCREYRQTATIGRQTEEIYGTACQEPDGSWRVATPS